MPAVIELDPEQRAMLEEALKKARHLVSELEKQKKEIDASPRPAHIDPEKYELGKHAMIKAIASAKRSLAALEDAERMASGPQDDDDEEEDDS
jgi:hypothetical protein